MRWITRARPKTDRVACPWLIKRFVDPDAEILFAPADRVLEAAREEGARSFDAPGADYTHVGDKCTFEVLIDEFDLGGDSALARLARIVHGADIAGETGVTPQSAGVLAIAEGMLATEPDDYEILRIGGRMYDALYEWCREHEPA